MTSVLHCNGDEQRVMSWARSGQPCCIPPMHKKKNLQGWHGSPLGIFFCDNRVDLWDWHACQCQVGAHQLESEPYSLPKCYINYRISGTALNGKVHSLESLILCLCLAGSVIKQRESEFNGVCFHIPVSQGLGLALQAGAHEKVSNPHLGYQGSAPHKKQSLIW